MPGFRFQETKVQGPRKGWWADEKVGGSWRTVNIRVHVFERDVYPVFYLYPFRTRNSLLCNTLSFLRTSLIFGVSCLSYFLGQDIEIHSGCTVITDLKIKTGTGEETRDLTRLTGDL